MKNQKLAWEKRSPPLKKRLPQRHPPIRRAREKVKEKYPSEEKVLNGPKMKEKFLSQSRARIRSNPTQQRDLRAETRKKANPTSRMMTIRYQMPLIMESTFQGFQSSESSQERSLVGLAPRLPNLSDKQAKLQPTACYRATDQRTAAR